MSGLLGVSGGVVLVPVLVLLLHFQQKHAQSTSLAAIVLTALILVPAFMLIFGLSPHEAQGTSLAVMILTDPGPARRIRRASGGPDSNRGPAGTDCSHDAHPAHRRPLLTQSHRMDQPMTSPPRSPTGQPQRSVAQKMGIRLGSHAHLVSAPPSAVTAMALPALEVSSTLEGQFDYLHLFTTSQADMDATFPLLRPHLAANGMLWVSWPKARKLGTDLTLPTVVRIGYSHGLVESTCLSVDDTWSGSSSPTPSRGRSTRTATAR